MAITRITVIFRDISRISSHNFFLKKKMGLRTENILKFNKLFHLILEHFWAGTLLPWLRYLLLIGDLELSKFLIIAPCIQPTANKIATK
jgi:hypothetical protein